MAVPHDARATPYTCADTRVFRQKYIYFSTSVPVSFHMIISENRFPFPMDAEDMLFGIMLQRPSASRLIRCAASREP
jgi:hypothetical protein